METIGVGLVGTGYMGKCHALAWNAVGATFGLTPRPVPALLCEVEPDLARRRAADFGYPRWTTDWRALVADADIEVVSIAAPNALHREIAVAALAAGKHVWCEKPMGLTLADAEAMTAAAERSAGQTLLGYNYIRNPAVAHARRLIEAGALGRVFHFRGAFDEDYMADPALPWSWRCRRAEAGLGVIGDMMCHLVSVAHSLVGEIAALAADIDIVHRERPLADGSGRHGAVDNEDVALALVRFAGGATGQLASSRASWGYKNGLRWEIHGDRGTLVFDQERMNELRLYEAAEPQATRGFRTILTGPAHPPYERFCPAPGHGLGFNELKVIEAAHLLDVIAGRAAPWIGFADGLRIERVVHAFERAQAEGRWVRPLD